VAILATRAEPNSKLGRERVPHPANPAVPTLAGTKTTQG